MRETLLITGGTGYLGGRIAQALSLRGWNLRLAFRPRPDKPPAWALDYELFPIDLCSTDGLAHACAGVTSIIHLAALNEIESLANPELATLVNTGGTIRLISAAEAAGVTRFLLLSTAHVYGAPLIGIISEKTLPRPIHPYAISKRGAEDHVFAAHDRGALVGIVVRLSNAFGWPADPDVRRWTLIVNDLCRQAVVHRKLTLRSSGLQRRDFVTITDVCRAVEHFLTLPPERVGNGLFNLGGENPLRVIDMAELIASRCATVLGFHPEIARQEPAPGEASPEVQYRIDKLKATGFDSHGDSASEIDSTLRLCETVFRGLHL
jgi:UDP-glucose 4-epimerase